MLSIVIMDGLCLSLIHIYRYSIGGEQSGHVIFLDFATTGDGQLTAVQLLGVMQRSGKKVSELASCMEAVSYTHLDVYKRQEQSARTN